MIRSLKSITTAAMLLVTTLVITGCEGEFDDLFGEWSRPTGNVNFGNEKPSGNIAVTSIMLNETSLEKKLGDAAVELTATVKPDNATDKTITWTSEDPAVASVSNGLVSILGEGTTIITATANDGSGVKATCTVTVKIPGLLAGKFTINASGDQVRFSQGNLQAVIAGYITTDPDHYTYTASSWKFAEHQWDYIGGSGGNSTFAVGSTVDLFGWVGTSATYNSYGLCTENSTTDTSDGSDFAKCYGNKNTDVLKSDWGKLAITNGGNTPNISGWRTLTGTEWGYLFKTRTASTVGGTDDGRYAKATVIGVAGIILFPDSYTHPSDVTAPISVNTTDAAFTVNTYNADAWSKMEAAGCVFLPAAGYRSGTSIDTNNSDGQYWSSTPYADNVTCACLLYFRATNMFFPDDATATPRYNGNSIRLVYDVK